MTHHSGSCERRALYNSGVRNGAFNCHDCRPGLDKNFRHVQGLQQMDCAAQGRVSGIPSSTPGVGPWAAAALQPHQLQGQGKGAEERFWELGEIFLLGWTSSPHSPSPLRQVTKTDSELGQGVWMSTVLARNTSLKSLPNPAVSNKNPCSILIGRRSL